MIQRVVTAQAASCVAMAMAMRDVAGRVKRQQPDVAGNLVEWAREVDGLAITMSRALLTGDRVRLTSAWMSARAIGMLIVAAGEPGPSPVCAGIFADAALHQRAMCVTDRADEHRASIARWTGLASG